VFSAHAERRTAQISVRYEIFLGVNRSQPRARLLRALGGAVGALV